MKLTQLFFGPDASLANPPDKVSSFRRLLPQFLASVAQNLLSGNMGLALAFPTIVVPAVLGLSKVINLNEPLRMTADEASWLASISFIAQPFGCFLSGIVCECIGRKKSIVAINIVPTIAWLLLANADTPVSTYIAIGLLGFGIGLTNSITYLTEVCEASIRGILMACSGIITTVAMFSVYLLGSFLPWRHVAFCSAIVPILNIIVAIFLPETPIWLLSKKRDDEAMASLQWLRGFVSSDAVAAELNQLKEVSKLSAESPGMMDKLKHMTQKRTLKPFILLSILFLLMQFSGLFATRPYIVPILSAYGISDANFTTVLLGVIGVMANVAILCSIRTLGKRNIYLYSMFGNLLTCVGLCVFGYAFFPADWSSVEASSAEAAKKSEIIKEIVGDWNYFALVMFLLMQFFLSVGVSSVPYFLMFEIFPFKSRSFYCSVIGALNQLVGFVATKTYYDSEKLLSLSGVFAFYGILAAIGYSLMYFMLPETEHRSLQDIEFHYSDKKKGLFDIDIRINAAATKPDSNDTKNEEKY